MARDQLASPLESLTEEEEGDVGEGEGAEEHVGRRPHRRVLEDDVAD